MMDFSSVVDSTLVFFGVGSILMWAWSTLNYDSSTVSTDAIEGSHAALNESRPWRLAA